MLTKLSENLLDAEVIMSIKFTDAYLKRIFSDDKLCILEYMSTLGIIRSEHRCQCNTSMSVIRKTRTADKYVWMCKQCRVECSIRVGSIFNGLKTDIETFFKFLILWCKTTLQNDIAYDLNVNKNTASKWCLLMRELIQNYLIENGEMLGGFDENNNPKIVEIDESLFFKRKYNRGRFINAQWVFGMVERGSTKCALFPVENRSAATLIPLIQAHVLPGSIIMSDSWAAYNQLDRDPSFQHFKINHSINFINPDDARVHTQTIENCWLHAKKQLKVQHGTKMEFMNGYLYEFIFKKKFKKKERINHLILMLRNSC